MLLAMWRVWGTVAALAVDARRNCLCIHKIRSSIATELLIEQMQNDDCTLLNGEKEGSRDPEMQK
jgi:hypothetical protein